MMGTPEPAERALRREIERLRALNKQARDALDQMLIWMPSGFAPQSKADAMKMARNAVKAIDAVNEQQPVSLAEMRQPEEREKNERMKALIDVVGQ